MNYVPKISMPCRLLLLNIFQVLSYSELMQTSFAVQYISKSFAELLLFRVPTEFAILDEYDLASIQIHIFLPGAHSLNIANCEVFSPTSNSQTDAG